MITGIRVTMAPDHETKHYWPAVYGVYAPPRPRRVLHSEVVEFRTETLRRRLPRITGDDSFLALSKVRGFEQPTKR
jgi:hypothetical protein